MTRGSRSTRRRPPTTASIQSPERLMLSTEVQERVGARDGFAHATWNVPRSCCGISKGSRSRRSAGARLEGQCGQAQRVPRRAEDAARARAVRRKLTAIDDHASDRRRAGPALLRRDGRPRGSACGSASRHLSAPANRTTRGCSGSWRSWTAHRPWMPPRDSSAWRGRGCSRHCPNVARVGCLVSPRRRGGSPGRRPRSSSSSDPSWRDGCCRGTHRSQCRRSADAGVRVDVRAGSRTDSARRSRRSPRSLADGARGAGERGGSAAPSTFPANRRARSSCLRRIDSIGRPR